MTTLVIALAFFAMAGLASAAKDKMLFHYYKSIFKRFKNQQFWNPSISWKNKYKDYNKGDLRAKFPLSKTVLVGFTDGFHLMKLVSEVSLFAGFAVIGYGIQESSNIVYTVSAYLTYKAVFEIGFRWVLGVTSRDLA